MRTAPELLRAATGCTQEAAERFADPLTEACIAYSIDSPVRLAAFLAQIGHESGGLRHVLELASGEAYEGRKNLGNTQPGDGPRFKGRGLIQTTGRANYVALRDRLRTWRTDVPDFEAEPDLLQQPLWAALSATDYWGWRELNALADAGDFEQITRRINGGLNGQADRLARWERAKAALLGIPDTPAPPAVSIPADEARTWPFPTPPETTMPLPAILGVLLPTLIEAIPKLGKLFGSGSAVAERNVKAAEMAMQIAKDALGATNAQETVERVAADPAAAATVAKAIEERWFELAEAGGGGIDGARKADAVAQASGEPVWRSPSFVMGCLLLPLVYLIVGNVTGLYGVNWAPEARAGIAGSLAGGIVMGIIGYYFGQTTSRNRTPAP